MTAYSVANTIALNQDLAVLHNLDGLNYHRGMVNGIDYLISERDVCKVLILEVVCRRLQLNIQNIGIAVIAYEL